MSSKIIKSVSTVGLMTLLSRITGLIRDIIFASILGDKAAADVFFVAFRIPNFFRRILGEGALSAAFVPVFTDYRMHRTREDVSSFLQLMLGRFGLLLLAISAIGVAGAPLLVSIVAAGFLDDPEKFNAAVSATRITFPYLFFISLVAVAAGMLNTCGRFAAPAATPILLNLCLIGAAVLLVPRVSSSPSALAVGVVAAGVVQLAFQVPFIRREGLTIRPRVVAKPEDKAGLDGVKKVGKLIIPAIYGVSVAQVSVFINTILASFLVTGSISWLYYADRLMEFPVGVFGIALSTVILPHLSRIRHATSGNAFSSSLDWASRWVVLICIPAMIGLVMLAEALVATIFYHGGFTTNGVRMTALGLIAFSVGMPAIVMVKVHAAGFFAHEDTRTPVKVAMYAMGLNIVFCLILVMPLKHVGLALATSLSMFFNSAWLFLLLRRKKLYRPEPGWLVFLCRCIVACLLMGIFLWLFRGNTGLWIELSIADRAMRLLGLILVAGIIYILALLLSGLRPRQLTMPETNES
ncbi:MAG: murein biosynthesis integral membrane protein MurJ [Gammaproteobacteria bacterium]|nr:murein biosynthesis integral membrane protein MurJ [Gammaproteobacteria bacterium]MCY4227734.1 murein biosynthesis integral membrane protein MurJ [Gammaproteobacteria bacterium]